MEGPEIKAVEAVIDNGSRPAASPSRPMALWPPTSTTIP